MKRKFINNAQLFSLLFIIYWIIVSVLGSVMPYIWPNFIDYNVVFIIKSVSTFLINIIIMVWIFFEAKKHNVNPYLWGAIAIFTGLISVVLFYWILTFKELKKINKL